MIFTITATVGTDYTLETASARGYIGESNAEQLAVSLGPFAQAGFERYCLHFDTLAFGGRFSSEPVTANSDGPVYLSGATLYCPLTERLTSTGRLRVQLEGQKTENGKRTIKKTSIITLEFLPSIMPSGAALGESGYDRLAALETEIVSVRAQITALEATCNAQTASELAALSARLSTLETAVTALQMSAQQSAYTLPAAAADTLGGVKVAQLNAVCKDDNGRLTVNECGLDWKLTTSLFIVSLLDFSTRLWVLIDDGSRTDAQVQQLFESYNMDVIDGNRDAMLFVSAHGGTRSYLDENYDSHPMMVVKGNLYVMRMLNDVLTIDSCAGESLRQLLIQGI
ncbi:MAG: hypothetical protein IJK64_03735 [Clostridia bacterium]|nr:hypothetical protein [Clostridia bacterium]